MNNWCPHCYGNARHTIQDAMFLANLNGGMYLSNKYKNNTSLLKWECENKHVWVSTYSSILRGAWCPECNIISNKQRKLGNIIRDITKSSITHNFKGFSWLRAPDSGYKLEIDIWVPKLKLAVEYDGEHHFMEKKFGNMSDSVAKDNLLRRKYLDCIKDIIIANNQKDVRYFFRVSYCDPVTIENITDKLRKIEVI